MHQVANNHHVLHGELPVLVFLLAVLALALSAEGGHGCAREERTVFIIVVAFLRLAVLVDPLHGALELLVVVNLEVYAAQYFHQVGILGAHAQIVLEEVGVDDASGNAHAGVAQREVRLATHGGHSLCCACKAQYFLGYVGRDGVVVQVLHVVSVDAEGGQSLLCVGSQYGSQIDGTRALRSVEAPYGLRIVGVHVHGLRAVAPARGDGDGRADALALELLGAGGALGNAANGRIGNHALNDASVAIAQVALNQVLYCLCQVHGLLFKTLADATLTTINRGANTNFRIVFAHIALVISITFACKNTKFFSFGSRKFC